jgi:cytochrome c2
MSTKMIKCVIVCGLAAGLFVGCAGKPSAESIAIGKVLVYTRCTACHAASRFEKHKYGRSEWESVITRMMGHGAQFTPEEQTRIADFLSTNFGK